MDNRKHMTQLLILDEPTNGLDPLGIEELRELIRSFPCKGITVILSSDAIRVRLSPPGQPSDQHRAGKQV